MQNQPHHLVWQRFLWLRAVINPFSFYILISSFCNSRALCIFAYLQRYTASCSNLYSAMDTKGLKRHHMPIAKGLLQLVAYVQVQNSCYLRENEEENFSPFAFLASKANLLERELRIRVFSSIEKEFKFVCRFGYLGANSPSRKVFDI